MACAPSHLDFECPLMNAPPSIRYAHTNIIARDWQRLVRFYQEVLGCVPVSTERDHRGSHIDKLTGYTGVRVRGRHLRLPGHGENGPTLEIFQYEPQGPDNPQALNKPGFAHLAFEVPDVAAKRAEIHGWGGRDVGELVIFEIVGTGKLTVIYITDPEGNILELQSWER
jgi:catechol 2,3-dioxygenase-like lactoylglutathione lyase family enzyme